MATVIGASILATGCEGGTQVELYDTVSRLVAEGVVRNRSGAPVAGLEVTGQLLPAGCPDIRVPGLLPTARTDETGRYRVTVAARGEPGCLRVETRGPDGSLSAETRDEVHPRSVPEEPDTVRLDLVVADHGSPAEIVAFEPPYAVTPEASHRLLVQVLDAFGNPVSGAPVSWSFPSGTVEAGDELTASDGIAAAVLRPTAPGTWNGSRVVFEAETTDGVAYSGEILVAPATLEPVILGRGAGRDLSENGGVTFMADLSGGERPAVWRDGVVTFLEQAGDRSVVEALSEEGEVVGWVERDGSRVAARWRGGVPTALPLDSFVASEARAVDGSGRIYGTVMRPNGIPHAATWHPDGRLELPFGSRGGGWIISDASPAGVYGGWRNGGGFVVTPTDTILDDLGYAVYGVNDSGEAVGFLFGSFYRIAFRRTDDGLRILYAGRDGVAVAIANDGFAVGHGGGGAAGAIVAELWPPDDEGGWYLEHLVTDRRWRIRGALDINDDHWILAAASHPEEGNVLVVLKPRVWPEGG